MTTRRLKRPRDPVQLAIADIAAEDPGAPFPQYRHAGAPDGHQAIPRGEFCAGWLCGARHREDVCGLSSLPAYVGALRLLRLCIGPVDAVKKECDWHAERLA